MSEYNIYRDELALTYSHYGYPLWDPAPKMPNDVVEVGDVGYILEGTFFRLFNALRPSSTSEGYEVLQTTNPHHIDSGTDNRKDFCSLNVTKVSRGYEFDSSGPDDDAKVTFSCSMGRGALLYLPFSAKRYDTIAQDAFSDWMKKHVAICLKIAKGRDPRINRMEDIILVTGLHRTKSWISAVFNDGQPSAQVSFGVYTLGASSVRIEKQEEKGGVLKLGPSGEDLPENQCIFLRGFRVRRSLWSSPKLRAA